MYKIDLQLAREELERQGKTSQELAKELGVNKNTMVSIFKTGNCRIDLFEKMAKFLNVEILEFIIDESRGITLGSILANEKILKNTACFIVFVYQYQLF